MPQEFSIPHGYEPRGYQLPLWTALEGGTKRAVCLWHRRTGKDLSLIHYSATQALQRVGLYWHLFPTYAQGKKAVWRGRDRDGKKFLDAFPEELITLRREDDMILELVNGSTYQVIGTDNIDNLMGANPIGLIFSEYGVQNPAAWNLLRPILAENGGWAVFIYTPRGRNHGYRLYNMAQKSERWFCEKLTVLDTHIIPADVLEEEREEMDSAFFEQEYMCSFDMPLEGAYYAEQLNWMREHKPPRITNTVVWDPQLPVVCGFDIGWRDSTAIWFAQIGRDIRIIDYYQNQGKAIDHYAKVLREKDYLYGDIYLPHDAAKTDLGTGKTYREMLAAHKFRCYVQPRMALADQHEMVRAYLRLSWIAEDTCEMGLDALGEYTKKPVPDQTTPDGKPLYQDEPLHNWASHGASAISTLFSGIQLDRDTTPFKQPDASYVV